MIKNGPKNSPYFRPVITTGWPAVCWAVLIFALSSFPPGIEEMPFPHFDKLAHMGVYSILWVFIYTPLREHAWKARHAALLALMLTSLYGALDEVHQLFVPLRCAEVADWLADTLGGVVGWTGIVFFNRVWRRNRHEPGTGA